MKYGLARSRRRLIGVCAVFFDEFVGIEAAFQFEHAHVHAFVEQQLQTAFGGIPPAVSGSKFTTIFGEYRLTLRTCAAVKAVPQLATTFLTPAA